MSSLYGFDYETGFCEAKYAVIEATIEWLYEKLNNGDIDVHYMEELIEDYKTRMGYKNSQFIKYINV